MNQIFEISFILFSLLLWLLVFGGGRSLNLCNNGHGRLQISVHVLRNRKIEMSSVGSAIRIYLKLSGDLLPNNHWM